MKKETPTAAEGDARRRRQSLQRCLSVHASSSSSNEGQVTKDSLSPPASARRVVQEAQNESVGAEPAATPCVAHEIPHELATPAFRALVQGSRQVPPEMLVSAACSGRKRRRPRRVDGASAGHAEG